MKQITTKKISLTFLCLFFGLLVSFSQTLPVSNMRSGTTTLQNTTYKVTDAQLVAWAKGSKSGVTIKGNGATIEYANNRSVSDKSKGLLEFTSWSNFRIENVKFKNIEVRIENCSNTVFDNIKISDQKYSQSSWGKKDGPYCLRVLGGNNNTVKNSTFTWNYKAHGQGIKVNNGSNHKFTNNNISGILISAMSVITDNNTVTGHTIKGGTFKKNDSNYSMEDHGIYLHNIQNVKVDDVTFEGWSDAGSGHGIKLKGVKKIEVFASHFKSKGGIIIREAANWQNNNHDIWIHGNRFDKFGVSSYGLSGSPGMYGSLLIEKNIFSTGKVDLSKDKSSDVNKNNALANKAGGANNNCISSSRLIVANGINKSGNGTNIGVCSENWNGDTGGGDTGGGDSTSSGNGTETFNNLSLSTWAAKTFTGVNGVKWTINEGKESTAINGKSLTLKRTKSVTSNAIGGGVKSISVKYKNQSSSVKRTIQIIVNGSSKGTFGTTGTATQTYTVNNLNISGNFTISIKNNSSGSTSQKLDIDDISWTSNGGSTGGGSGDCTATAITPYRLIEGETWKNDKLVSMSAGKDLTFGPWPGSGGSWKWTGPNGFTSSIREFKINNITTGQAGNYIATYTDGSGCTSNKTFQVTVSGSTGGSTGGGLGECTATSITPYRLIEGETWKNDKFVSMSAGKDLTFGHWPGSGGSWKWTGPNGFTSSIREFKINNITTGQAGDYTATYTDGSGCTSNKTFQVTVSGSTGGSTGGSNGTETFNNLSLSTWSGVTFTGVNSVRWTINEGKESTAINGKSLTLKRTKSVTSSAIPGGVRSISVKYKNQSSSVNRTIQIIVNGSVRGTFGTAGTATQTYTVNNLNITGNFTIAIKNNSSGSTAQKLDIDDISWTTNSTSTRSAKTKKGVLLTEEIIDTDFKIYPNPFKDQLTIKLGYDNKINRVLLMNVNGQVILEKTINDEQKINLNMENIAINKGIYFLRVIDSNNVKTIKLIKN